MQHIIAIRAAKRYRRLRRRQRRDPSGLTIYNPNPVVAAYSSGNFNLYTSRSQWFNCSDATAPGIKPILDYLAELPYEVSPNCQAGAFYNAVNVNPAWTPGGTPQGGTIVPRQTIRSIGDVLSAKNIPWKYYGGGYNLSVAGNPINGYCNICNPFEYQANYPAMRADHMRDVTDLFVDIQNGTLPAVSCQAGRRHRRPPGVVEVQHLRGLHGQHHQPGPVEPGGVEGYRDLRHLRRGWRLLRLGLHPACRLLRQRPAHPDDRGLAVLARRHIVTTTMTTCRS